MTTKDNEIIVKLSKKKIVLLTLGSIAFVVLGLWIWGISDTEAWYNSIVLKAVSMSAILFFGLCGIYGFSKLFDGRPGLIINQFGIQDNSSAVSGELIKWTDIEGFKTIKVEKTRFLLIFVSNPQFFLDNSNKFKRFWMKMNWKMYGTPLSISSNSLQFDFDDLVKTIKEAKEKHCA